MSQMKKGFRLKGVALTDIGNVRKRNEDAFAECPQEQLFVLADGMGGHRGGDVASRASVHGFCAIVKDALENQPTPLTAEKGAEIVREAIEEVNRIIYRMGQQDHLLRGMGTTLCAILNVGTSVVIAHVGDSRVYLFHEGKLKQVTEDHSLRRELIEMGQIEEHEEEGTYKNILTRAIGTEPTVQPDSLILPLKGGEKFLICSDGLTEHLKDEEIEEVLKKWPDLKESTEILLQTAKRRGGHDNITLLLLEVILDRN